jgi:hypothetical protein
VADDGYLAYLMNLVIAGYYAAVQIVYAIQTGEMATVIEYLAICISLLQRDGRR